ncbi:MAG: hypothetical protein BWK73_46790 [Thiothrix lacustris]|uniref:Uncharacterized protein n=1 Tax=Thiothrix lacustris TaxID=525917 RepID=A0A1Y1QA71_9GAMM|nr:MAG: hypothetical protein BWK73_46790 [Thiothrix lacustris]
MKIKLITAVVLASSSMMISSNAHALSMAEILALAFAGPSTTSAANNTALQATQTAVQQIGAAQDKATNPTSAGAGTPGGAGGNSLLDNIIQQQQIATGIIIPASIIQ